jgi:CO dehydrogenase/acetyl-CoA synthase delta subunit
VSGIKENYLLFDPASEAQVLGIKGITYSLTQHQRLRCCGIKGDYLLLDPSSQA